MSHSKPTESHWPRATTLHELAERLGPLVLRPTEAAGDGERRAGETVIFDPDEPLAETPDGVLLAVGLTPGDPTALELVTRAAAAGFAAIVVKARGADISGLAEAARGRGLALLVTSEELPWRRLDALITTATSKSGVAGAGGGSPDDLFALANAIALEVGGAVSIEDPAGRVLAYSNLPHQEIDEVRQQGILGRQTPERPTNLEEYRSVFQAEGTYRFAAESETGLSRLAIAVRAGSQILGIIFVLDGRPPLGEHASEALARAATVTATHLLRFGSHGDAEHWNRAEVVTSLLDGRLPGWVAASQLGVPHDRPVAVLAIAAAQDSEPLGLASAWIVELLRRYSSTWHADTLFAVDGPVVYLLAPIAQGRDEARLAEFALELVRYVKTSGRLDVHVGVGETVGGLEEAAGSRRGADAVLRVLAWKERAPGAATLREVRSSAALLELARTPAGSRRLPGAPVSRLIDYDLEHNTTYARTLLAFLNASGDAAKAAKELFVHENTLRYRMRKIREMFELRLEEPDELLGMWLQLYLAEPELPLSVSPMGDDRFV